tara:strand:+ start:208 stop:465 length:258 start_codon:yes stop_codon:yes gene_type:complete
MKRKSRESRMRSWEVKSIYTCIAAQLTPPVPMVKTVIPGFIFSGPNMSAFTAVPAAQGKAVVSSNVRCAGAGRSSLSGFTTPFVI